MRLKNASSSTAVRRLGPRFAALILAGALTACSTSYRPAPSPRIVSVLEGGSPAYLRDGLTIDAGLFGTGLVEAVEGVPAARDHAESFRDLTIGGFVVALIGAGAAGGGLGWAAGSVERDDELIAPLALSIGGLAASIVGLSLLIAAQPHQFDAINIYNDAVAPSGPMPPMAAPPSWGPAVAPPGPMPAQPVMPPPALPAQPMAPPAPPVTP